MKLIVPIFIILLTTTGCSGIQPVPLHYDEKSTCLESINYGIEAIAKKRSVKPTKINVKQLAGLRSGLGMLAIRTSNLTEKKSIKHTFTIIRKENECHLVLIQEASSNKSQVLFGPVEPVTTYTNTLSGIESIAIPGCDCGRASD